MRFSQAITYVAGSIRLGSVGSALACLLLAIAGEAQAGMICSLEFDAHTTAALTADPLPSSVPPDQDDDGQLQADLLDAQAPSSGLGGSGTSAGVSSSVAALPTANCRLVCPSLVSRWIGERKLFLPAPPTSDFLRPPRAR